MLIEVDFEKSALLRVHRGFEELLRVHLTKTFESLDGEAAFADIDNTLEDFGDREDGVRCGLVAFAFMELEQRSIMVREVLDLKAFLRQLIDEFLDWNRLMKLHESGSAADRRLVFLCFGLLLRKLPLGCIL